MSEVATRGRRWSCGMSGGQMTRRRATPSSSIIAKAAVSCSRAATRAERPWKAPSRPPRLEPLTRSVNAPLSRAPQKYRGGPATPSSHRRSGRASLCSIFVDAYEVAESDGKADVFRGRERIDAELVLEPCHQHREAQGVEPGIHQHGVAAQRSQLLLMLRGNPFDLGKYC